MNKQWHTISARKRARELEEKGLSPDSALRIARQEKYGHPSYVNAESAERMKGSSLDLLTYWRFVFEKLALNVSHKTVITIGGNSGVELTAMNMGRIAGLAAAGVDIRALMGAVL